MEDVRGWFWLWPSGTGVSTNLSALLVLERILVVVFNMVHSSTSGLLKPWLESNVNLKQFI